MSIVRAICVSRIFYIRDTSFHLRDLPMLTRALMGIWIFHHLMDGGVFEHPSVYLGSCAPYNKTENGVRKLWKKSF